MTELSGDEEASFEAEEPAKVAWAVESHTNRREAESVGRPFDDIGTVQEESPPFKAFKSPG